MATYTFYTNNGGQLQFTDEGTYVLNLLKQQNSAWENNQQYVFSWFKGMNINPTGSNVYEFADELQEYVKFNGKKSIWDQTNQVVTGE